MSKKRRSGAPLPPKVRCGSAIGLGRFPCQLYFQTQICNLNLRPCRQSRLCSEQGQLLPKPSGALGCTVLISINIYEACGFPWESRRPSQAKRHLSLFAPPPGPSEPSFLQGAQCRETIPQQGPNGSFSGCKNRYLLLWGTGSVLPLPSLRSAKVSEEQGFPHCPLMCPDPGDSRAEGTRYMNAV